LVRIGVGKRDNALIVTIAPRRRDCVSSRTIEYLHPGAFIQSDIFNHEIATGIDRIDGMPPRQSESDALALHSKRAKLGASFLRPSGIIGPIAMQLGAFG
jgi:hypothetical protein